MPGIAAFAHPFLGCFSSYSSASHFVRIQSGCRSYTLLGHAALLTVRKRELISLFANINLFYLLRDIYQLRRYCFQKLVEQVLLSSPNNHAPLPPKKPRSHRPHLKAAKLVSWEELPLFCFPSVDEVSDSRKASLWLMFHQNVTKMRAFSTYTANDLSLNVLIHPVARNLL